MSFPYSYGDIELLTAWVDDSGYYGWYPIYYIDYRGGGDLERFVRGEDTEYSGYTYYYYLYGYYSYSGDNAGGYGAYPN
mgnify:FL=1